MPLLIGKENQRLVQGIDAINAPQAEEKAGVVEEVVETMGLDPSEFNKTEEVTGVPVAVVEEVEEELPFEAEPEKPAKPAASKKKRTTKKK